MVSHRHYGSADLPNCDVSRRSKFSLKLAGRDAQVASQHCELTGLLAARTGKRVDHEINAQKLWQDLGLLGVVWVIYEVERHSCAAVSRKFSANGFVALRPIAAEPLKTVCVQGRKDFVVGEYPAFVDLARDAPVGCEAHEHRVAGFERAFNCSRVVINPRFITRRS